MVVVGVKEIGISRGHIPNDILVVNLLELDGVKPLGQLSLKLLLVKHLVPKVYLKFLNVHICPLLRRSERQPESKLSLCQLLLQNVC